MKEIFIVVDGTDGAGKTEQVKRLKDRLEAEGKQVFVSDYPVYDCESSFFVRNYLNGEYGSAKEVGPYRAASFYAVDRFHHDAKVRKFLAEGKIGLSNRYVSASAGHQGGKIQNLKEREEFLDWLYWLEYKMYGIVKPTINIILHVSPATSQRLVDKKGARDYVGGQQKRDIHEADINHLRDSEQTFLYLCEKHPEYVLIECEKDGEIMSPEAIHELVYAEVKKYL